MSTIKGGAVAYIRAGGETKEIRDINAASQRSTCEKVARSLNTHITEFYADSGSNWVGRGMAQPQLEQLLSDLPRLQPKYVIIEHVGILIPVYSIPKYILEDKIRIHEISLQILRQGVSLEIAMDTSHITK